VRPGQESRSQSAPSLVWAYQAAKIDVVCAGYAGEIEWQQSLCFEETTESDFLREHAWVVLCCGMRESVVRTRFPRIAACFHGWESAHQVLASLPKSRERALEHFRHPGKIEAILACADWVAAAGFASAKEMIRLDPVGTLQSLPFIGPVTAYHLAKNLGLPVAKPDRHLARLAAAAGYQDVHAFCSDISAHSGDPVPVVDIVLWRFATIRPSYVRAFSEGLRHDVGARRGAATRRRVVAQAAP
jgi:hypothetical protein